MLNAEIKNVLKVKNGKLESAEVLFFGINVESYVEIVDFSFSPSLSDELTADQKKAALNAEFIYDSCE